MSPLQQHPSPSLLARVSAELSAAFGSGATSLGRAPAALDVMAGIAQETGSVACTIQLDRPAAAVIAQDRADAQLQVFSFNELDAHRPFTLIVPMRALATLDGSALRAGLVEPGRRWAWPIVGAVWEILAENRLDPRRPRDRGMNVALLSTIPADRGFAENAALAAANVSAMAAHLGMAGAGDTLTQAQRCVAIQQAALGCAHPTGNYLASLSAAPGFVHRFAADLGTILPPLRVPTGMRFVAIDTGVARSASDPRLQTARTAAALAHTLILQKMRDIGIAAGRTLVADPTGGFLARLDSNDYKRWFRPYLPETIRGDAAIALLGDSTPHRADMQADIEYPVRGVADHHVLDALRIRNFCKFLEQADGLPLDDPTRGIALDKAGHLMYASHQSLSEDARLGVGQADLLVRLLRRREPHGLYGARLTSTGRGGLVAVLCEDNERATTAIADVLADYAAETNLVPATYRTAPVEAAEPGSTAILGHGSAGITTIAASADLRPSDSA